MKCLVLSIELFLMNLKKHDEVRFVWLNEGISSTDVSTEGSLFLMAADPSMRWAPNCWCKLGPKGAPTPQYSSPKGQRTKGPLRRTTPSSSSTATSTTSTTTRQ
jgi:hypothetical protein